VAGDKRAPAVLLIAIDSPATRPAAGVLASNTAPVLSAKHAHDTIADGSAPQPGSTEGTSGASEAYWRKVLLEGHRPIRFGRRAFRLIPAAPRCKFCASPFAGVGGRLFRLVGHGRSRKNPNMCAACCEGLPRGGAEVDIAVLFADVRGSTTLGERSSTSTFAELLNRFYAAATEVLLRHDAVIDKLIGDELMAFFAPGMCGRNYRRHAVQAALEILHAVGYGTPEGPWLEVGVGVNAGQAYVGNVGAGGVTDFTALGDPVNVASRLQAQAAAGEVVVAEDLCEGLADLLPRPRRETIELRGRDQALRALVSSATRG
jgi:adenylate cyclase